MARPPLLRMTIVLQEAAVLVVAAVPEAAVALAVAVATPVARVALMGRHLVRVPVDNLERYGPDSVTVEGK
jgi:hypothetical protein